MRTRRTRSMDTMERPPYPGRQLLILGKLENKEYGNLTDG